MVAVVLNVEPEVIEIFTQLSLFVDTSIGLKLRLPGNSCDHMAPNGENHLPIDVNPRHLRAIF